MSSQSVSDDFYLEFGRRARALRRSAGLTQAEVALQLGLTRASVANIEAGRQRLLLHQAVAFAELCDLGIVALIPSLRQSTIDQDPSEIDDANKAIARQFEVAES